MQRHEPEQGRQSAQEWQMGSEYSAYDAGYSASYNSQLEQQKIYPQEARQGAGFAILAIVFSSLSFFLTVAGIVGSAIVLQFANGQKAILAGGAIGLATSILVMLICVASFAIAVIALARPGAFASRRGRVFRGSIGRPPSWRRKGLGE